MGWCHDRVHARRRGGRPVARRHVQGHARHQRRAPRREAARPRRVGDAVPAHARARDVRARDLRRHDPGRDHRAPQGRSAHRGDGRLLLRPRAAVPDLVAAGSRRLDPAHADRGARRRRAGDGPRHGAHRALPRARAGAAVLRHRGRDAGWVDARVVSRRRHPRRTDPARRRAGPLGDERGVLVLAQRQRLFLVDPASMEFPRVDDRRIGRRHGVVALGTTTGTQRLVPGDHDAVLWLDPETGRTVRWDAPEFAVGEPCFVPRPGDDDSAHGWWVTFALERADRSSCFLVFSGARSGCGTGGDGADPGARPARPARGVAPDRGVDRPGTTDAPAATCAAGASFVPCGDYWTS
ncbi:MAG: hypothetical protein AVDCRST_MAG54-1770 [uncultured Actinomycetospora sp.]|uniref:Dioxygenase n=1 Tax=uncultured Actinomycetospora sp. TaxID=1135996 RepID=A0A6J4IB36_9PSEU|nr:MAG: hypothetical protein AVDCRST_MAG54-1770 [uncultured Actinomycetospora sp.]